MNDEYFARVLAAKLEDDPLMVGFEWKDYNGLLCVADDAPKNTEFGFPLYFIKHYAGGGIDSPAGWKVYDRAAFPVSGPFPDRKAAMFALLLMRGA